MTRFCLTALVTLAVVLPVAAQDMPLSQVLLPSEGWKALPGEFSTVTAAPDGTILVVKSATKELHRLVGLELSKPLAVGSGRITSLAVAPDGAIYAAQPGERRVVRVKLDGREETVAQGHAFTVLAISPAGRLYATAAGSDDIFLLPADKGDVEIAAAGVKNPTGILFTPDGGTAVVGVREDGYLLAFGVDPKNHHLTHPDRYYYPVRRITDGDGGRLFAETASLTQDRAGRVYAATAAGVQVFDPTGRPCGVLLAAGPKLPTGLALGGPDGATLYVLHGETLYFRKTRTQFVGKAEKPK